MIRAFALIMLLAGCAVTPAEPETAQPGEIVEILCGPRSMLLASLETGNGQTTAAIALTEYGDVMEMVTAADGSWSMVISNPGGLSCVMLSGQGWQEVKKGQGV
jgi:hypothetical protein